MLIPSKPQITCNNIISDKPKHNSVCVCVCVCECECVHLHTCTCICVCVCACVFRCEHTQFRSPSLSSWSVASSSMMTVYLCGVRGQSEPSHPHGDIYRPVNLSLSLSAVLTPAVTTKGQQLSQVWALSSDQDIVAWTPTVTHHSVLFSFCPLFINLFVYLFCWKCYQKI